MSTKKEYISNQEIILFLLIFSIIIVGISVCFSTTSRETEKTRNRVKAENSAMIGIFQSAGAGDIVKLPGGSLRMVWKTSDKYVWFENFNTNAAKMRIEELVRMKAELTKVEETEYKKKIQEFVLKH